MKPAVRSAVDANGFRRWLGFDGHRTVAQVDAERLKAATQQRFWEV